MLRKYFVPALLLLVLSACGLSNTMYNARNYFKSAQSRPLNSNGRPTSQAIEEYTKTIQKCGIIISEKKNDKQVEEALYLMARALYYKGNSAFQAKDQFENLVNLFPESKHVPEAYIYLARIYREINQPDEAESRLESFIRNPRFRESHPKALLVLADFEIRDKDYLRADYWLQKVVNDYDQSKEAKEAQFLIGKNFYEQGLYEQSLTSFQSLAGSFRLDRMLKLDAQYYMSLNRYQLKQYDRAIDLINQVLKNESRLDKLGQAKILKARILADSDRLDEGMAELEAVLRDYPRTQASSDAAYYLGEYSFFRKQDRSAANTYYGRVRTELPTGQFVTKSQGRVSALQQLGQGSNLNSETNLQQYLDYYYLAADNYDKRFNLPDSSLIMYDRLLSEKDRLQSIVDSLSILKTELEARIDSLRIVRANPPDSVDTTSHPDSIQIDSRIATLETEVQSLEGRASRIEESITRFDQEVIPFVWFVKANLRMKMGQKDPEVAEILELMRNTYPGHKYTNAIRSLYNGQRVRVVDTVVEEAEERLDYALGLFPAQPDSMVIALSELSESPLDEIRLKANFRLGWYYAVENPDTTAAKNYLDIVLESSDSGAYGDWVRKIYDGSKFLIYEPDTSIDSLSLDLPDNSAITISDSLIAVDSLATVSDSLASSEPETEESLPDSEPLPELEINSAEADSLNLEAQPREDIPVSESELTPNIQTAGEGADNPETPQEPPVLPSPDTPTEPDAAPESELNPDSTGEEANDQSDETQPIPPIDTPDQPEEADTDSIGTE